MATAIKFACSSAKIVDVVLDNNSEQFRNCFIASEINRTLSIANSKRHGFADLTLHEQEIDRKVKIVNDDRIDTDVPSSRRCKLHYDGESYVVPRELQY